MKSIIISIFVCVFIVASGFQAYGEELTAEQKEVWNAVVADVENFKTGDVDKVMEARHDDLILWWNNKSLPFDKELARYNYKGWFGYEIPKNWELNPLTIKISGNIAIVAYTYKISGELYSDNGRSFDVWVKQNNKWLLLGSTGASCEKPAKCQ
jgi:ketosteroid isomerase-like protein